MNDLLTCTLYLGWLWLACYDPHTCVLAPRLLAGYGWQILNHWPAYLRTSLSMIDSSWPTYLHTWALTIGWLWLASFDPLTCILTPCFLAGYDSLIFTHIPPFFVGYDWLITTHIPAFFVGCDWLIMTHIPAFFILAPCFSAGYDWLIFTHWPAYLPPVSPSSCAASSRCPSRRRRYSALRNSTTRPSCSFRLILGHFLSLTCSITA